ncbi:MAG TPA: dihydropteroate synthase [Dermatophilaceae bacterium]|nr:dihydropteroate synthase [Dermatophilaceae bacterium]
MLRLGRHSFHDSAMLVMAIVNRTPDSFYDRGATFDENTALARITRVVEEGADIVDIGGVKAGPGATVTVEQEEDRVLGLVSATRLRFPEVVISVDTWRHEVARRACEAGADLLNDAWGGFDPQLAEVAAEFGAALVCAHTGGLEPRTRPHRSAYPGDIVEEVRRACLDLVERAVGCGVSADSLLVDPAHDFAKNTWHSLEITRRLSELVAEGYPVLVSLSHKDFIGESLDLPVSQRLAGTLAATAVCAYQGARVFRAHDVAATRQVLDMVATIRGDRPPQRVVRGLA